MIDILPETMIIKPCEICGEPTYPMHHKLPQTKQNRKIFGSLIDLPFNKQWTCAGCNMSHSGQGKGLTVWKRVDFLTALKEYLEKEGY